MFRSRGLFVAAAFCFFASNEIYANTNTSKLRNFRFPHVKDEVLVKFTKLVSRDIELDPLFLQYGARIEHTFKSSSANLIKVNKNLKADSLIKFAKKLAARSDVEFIEANTIMRTHQFDGITPNDPRFSEQYALDNSGQSNGTADADIDAPEAWTMTQGSKDVVVAIIDTGINYSHPDIKENIWVNPGESGVDAAGADKKTNGVDDDQNGFVDDWRGWDFVNKDNDPYDDNGVNHGSHCAGVIGAKANDGFGMAGINWSVGLVGIKFLSAAGGGSLADGVKAIEYANSLGVDIQSNSWGGGGFSQVMFDAITAAEKLGILFVAAAGNDGMDTDDLAHYPSSYTAENIISVAATDRNDQIASFSNFGKKSVDTAAPGVDILSLANAEDFRVLSGTSMATPHVAGAAALIKAKYPELKYAGLKSRLLNGVDPIASLKGSSQTGGRLNLWNAIEDDQLPPSAVAAGQQTKAERQSLEILWQAAGDDGEQGRALRYEIRISEREILTDEDWNRAQHAEVTFAGTADAPSAQLQNLRFNYSGFAQVRAMDNVGNFGPLGVNIAIGVQKINVLYHHNADDLENIEHEGLWSTESLAAENRTAFSDSPASIYANDLNISLALPIVTVPIKALRNASGPIGLAFFTKTELEKGYDFGLVEASTDNGSTWTELAKITGNKSWHSRVIDIPEPLLHSRSLKIRFRMTTDYVIQGDGWFVDDVMVISD